MADSTTGEKFILYTEPIVNDKHYVIGVVVAGKSIAYINIILRDYILAEGIAGILLSLLTFFLIVKAARVYVKDAKPLEMEKAEIHTISFDKKAAVLFLDKNEIQLPYATNQYYLVAALFSAPKKRWETDELLDKFGEISNMNVRKVYDAMNMVNKKVTHILDGKLIILKDKTYQINPTLSTKIQ